MIGSRLDTALQIGIGGFVNNAFPTFVRNFNGFCNHNRRILPVAKDYGEKRKLWEIVILGDEYIRAGLDSNDSQTRWKVW